ncbi:MAG: ABC transporter permease [Oscillospiraceae bacterium]|nr:ABC transporter permease [Oscillospiraceae bacterium]
MKAFFTMLKNEIKLSLRDMNMVIFAVLMPLAVLAVLGIIYKSKPAFDGADYTFAEQSFGALCAISGCAGGLMGLPITVSELRERKILKRYRVTPMSPVLLLAAELAVFMLYALVSMLTLLAATAIFWSFPIHGSAAAFIGSWLLTLVSTLSIGLLVGGIAKNTKQAGVIASILYFPMLIFSGTTLPIEVMPEVMRKIVGVFPLTQGIELMKATSLNAPMENIWLPIAVMAFVTVVCSTLSVIFFKWE